MTAPLAAGRPTTVTVPAQAPFDFAASLRFLHEFPAMTGEQHTSGGQLTKALRVAGHTVVARLSALPDGPPGLNAELHSATPLAPDAVAAAVDRIGFFLSLDDDLAEFYALAHDDPAFAEIVGRLHGYHQVKFPSPLENLVWAILVQRVPMPVATTIKNSLVGHFDNRLLVAGVDHVAFPDLTQLAGLSLDRLTGLVGNERKARYLHGALRGWTEVDEQFLRAGPYEQVKQFLLSLPGIGEWSANFVLIRGLGRMEEIPADKALLSAAQRAYHRRLSEVELQSIGARYGPWRGYWAHYLRVGG